MDELGIEQRQSCGRCRSGLDCMVRVVTAQQVVDSTLTSSCWNCRRILTHFVPSQMLARHRARSDMLGKRFWLQTPRSTTPVS